MKQSSKKKMYIVARQNPYENVWYKRTDLLTYLQAVKFVSTKNWHDQIHKGKVKIVTESEFNQLIIQGA